MCGRYFFEIPENENGNKLRRLVQQFSLFDFAQGEVFPGMNVLAFVYNNNAHIYEPRKFKWGITMGFSTKPIINARVESLKSKPTFSNIIDNRAVIICNGYYEWHDHREKFYLSNQNHEIFLACLYKDDEIVIVTGSSEGVMKAIHHRNPIIIAKKDVRKYLKNEYDLVVNNEGLTAELMNYHDLSK